MLVIRTNLLNGGSPVPLTAEERAIKVIRQLNVSDLSEHLTHIYMEEFNSDISRLNEAIEVLQNVAYLISVGKEEADEETVNLIWEYLELGCEMFNIYIEESRKRWH